MKITIEIGCLLAKQKLNVIDIKSQLCGYCGPCEAKGKRLSAFECCQSVELHEEGLTQLATSNENRRTKKYFFLFIEASGSLTKQKIISLT